MTGPHSQKLLLPGVRALETRDLSLKKHQVMLPAVSSEDYSQLPTSVATPKTKKRGADEEGEAPAKKKGKGE